MNIVLFAEGLKCQFSGTVVLSNMHSFHTVNVRSLFLPSSPDCAEPKRQCQKYYECLLLIAVSRSLFVGNSDIITTNLRIL